MKMVTAYRRAINLIGIKDRRKYLSVMLIHAGLGVMDLIGVVLIGIIGALSISGVMSNEPGNRTARLLEFLQISNFTFQNQVALLAVCAAIVLVSKTLISIILTRKILFFLSNKSAELSRRLTETVMLQPINAIKNQNTQQLQYSFGAGVNSIVIGILGIGATIFADVFLLSIIALGIFSIDPLMAFSASMIFSLTGLVLYLSLHQKSRFLGKVIAEKNVEINSRISEVISAYREIFVRNSRLKFVENISKNRKEVSILAAEQTFMPSVGKYVIEIATISGGLVMAGIQFSLFDATKAAGSLTLFIAAASRVAPAILRLQQSFTQIQGHIGSAEKTFGLFYSSKTEVPIEMDQIEMDLNHNGFSPSINADGLSFTYPSENSASIREVSFRISEGSFTALVGISGSGKSTLVDLILGVHTPTHGEVNISLTDPKTAIEKWPGAIGYVPQEVAIIEASIRENLLLGTESKILSDAICIKALKDANLGGLLSKKNFNLDWQAGEKGYKLSGGERQRLGIARALVTNPKILIFDEATSALDAQTELDITKSILQLKGSRTIVMIAHRLSLVRKADQIIYLENGRVISQGTFEEVRASVPDFDLQARLMGL